MITDLNKFEKGVTLAPGLLWVVEQIPGLVESADLTDMLLEGYWGSYNVPYFAKVSQSNTMMYADWIRFAWECCLIDLAYANCVCLGTGVQCVRLPGHGLQGRCVWTALYKGS